VGFFEDGDALPRVFGLRQRALQLLHLKKAGTRRRVLVEETPSTKGVQVFLASTSSVGRRPRTYARLRGYAAAAAAAVPLPTSGLPRAP
jgi:hypothetical protein